MLSTLCRLFPVLVFVTMLSVPALAQKGAAMPPAPPAENQAMDEGTAPDMQCMRMHGMNREHMRGKGMDNNAGECPLGLFGKGPLCCPKGVMPFLLPIIIMVKMIVACSVLCFLMCILLHILLAILVFNDMRRRGDVNGLWIPVVLIGGIFATMAYALLRQKDVKQA